MRFKHFLLTLLIIVAVFCFATTRDDAAIANKNHKINGWAWSENIGWLSLNCYNDGFLEANKCASADYGIDYDLNTGELYGYAWGDKDYSGWVCFGKSCATVAGLALSPDNVAPKAIINANGMVSGWANYVALGQDGWIKLQGPAVSLPGLKFACKNCSQMKADSKTDCGVCFASGLNNGSADICTDCHDCLNGTCQTCGSCFKYGVAVDYGLNQLLGWSWNGNADKSGFGWLKFHPLQTKTAVFPPYLETVSGDVYSQKGLGDLTDGATPASKYNAVYLLQSNGDIIHFNTSSANSWVTEDAAVQSPPKKEGNYRSSLANIDLPGLFAGQYGALESLIHTKTVVVGLKAYTYLDGTEIDNPLGGKVYYGVGNLMTSTLNLNNSAGDVSATGTIVIKGNLYIDQNIVYTPAAVTKPRNLASLGVIVLKNDAGLGGNIYIKDSVTSVAGNFLAEDTIYTGSAGTSTPDKTLQVNGLMIARQFKFQRNLADIKDSVPSERVVYDGRIFANTPPGFADITDAMPVWK